MSTRRILGRAGSEAAGSVTFNSPATWVSPPRLLNVTVTGVGAAGEPGQVGVAGTGGAGSTVRGFPGNLPDICRKNPGNVKEILGSYQKFHRTFKNFPGFFLEFPGNF